MTSMLWLEEVMRDIEAGVRLRRELPGGGLIYIERPLPFLTVYRHPGIVEEQISSQLVSSQAAYLIAPNDKRSHRHTVELIRRLADWYMQRFEAYLVMDIWTGSNEEYPLLKHGESGEVLIPAPQFKTFANPIRYSPQTVETLTRSLRKTRIQKHTATVESLKVERFGPQGCAALATSRDLRKTGCHIMGLEVRPIFRDPGTGEIYPGVLRSLRRSLNRALTRTYFTFAQSCSNIRPRHFHTLGRRSFVKVVWETDRQLTAVENTFDLLLQATPTNTEAAWLALKRKRFETAPVFQYRPLAVDPVELKRRLFQVPINRIEDPTIAMLLRQKQDELDRRITMLSDVGTGRFRYGSYQVYGMVDDKLLGLAKDLAEHIPARIRRTTPKRQLTAEEFAALAEIEVRHYQSIDSSFQPQIEIRDDIFSGLLVSQGRLLIGRKATVPIERADALLQHEIGTHLLTCHNGNNQPFWQLALGLAGYDQLQEGLAVLAEYMVGGLNRTRLRLLAARVLAVKSLIDGANFLETFRLLSSELGYSRRVAYTVTMRVHRAGGLTKDASYLRGLVEILEYLGGGGDLEPLLVGKIAVDHVPLIEELRLRQVLRAPILRPRYLESEDFAERISRVRGGIDVMQLLEN